MFSYTPLETYQYLYLAANSEAANHFRYIAMVELSLNERTTIQLLQWSNVALKNCYNLDRRLQEFLNTSSPEDTKAMIDWVAGQIQNYP